MATSKEWAAALRSGQYEQASGYLFLPGDADADADGEPARFCCLGVRMVLDGYALDALEGREAPDEVDADLQFEGTADEFFAWLNDGAGYSFQQIADVLENRDAAKRALEAYKDADSRTLQSVGDFKKKYCEVTP